MAVRFMSDRSLIPEMVYMYVIHKLGHSYGHYFPPRLEFYERDALTYSASHLPSLLRGLFRSTWQVLIYINKVVGLVGAH